MQHGLKSAVVSLNEVASLATTFETASVATAGKVKTVIIPFKCQTLIVIHFTLLLNQSFTLLIQAKHFEDDHLTVKTSNITSP